ncbi:hypothetical protein L1987_38045 [Smallanthus sonchifolius]|uniref:Uncharacterized protein n=1 Tax=Smallanthus sonchifolius TaxID=185202 RepID=A0ACB9HJA3_9ASTR|nr:hypothetical protein L1987_38045 [Smallanthus sonchifolius]
MKVIPSIVVSSSESKCSFLQVLSKPIFREREIKSSFLVMKMKRCELCKSMARVYCDSDRASLCWTCDAKVHSANFLVAKHSRTLLCALCQSPTPWTASGEKLWPSAASSCERCDEGVGGNKVETDNVDGDEIDNKGVPRSWNSLPPPTSSSSSEEFFAGDRGGLRKRKIRNFADNSHEDEIDSSSVNINHNRPSAIMPEQPIGDETVSFDSTVSSSVGTDDDEKKLRNRNTVYVDYMHAHVLRKGKSRRTVDFDLNL